MSPNLKVLWVIMILRAARSARPLVVSGSISGRTDKAWSVFIVGYMLIASAVKIQAVFGRLGSDWRWVTKSELSRM